MLPKSTAWWILFLCAPLHAIELRRDVAGSFGAANSCVPGMLRGDVYELLPETTSLPKLEKMKPTGVVCSYSLNIPLRSFLEGIPGVTTRIEWFAIDYQADFWIETPGAYMFTLASDDGSKLYIDGKSVIDNDGVHSILELGGRAKLEPGRHHMRVSYFQGPRESVALILKIAPPHGNFEIFDLRTYRLRETAKATATQWAADFLGDARPVLRRASEAHDPLAAKAYELPALAALVANPRPHDFNAYSKAYRFHASAGAGGGSTQCAIAVGVPVAELTARSSPADSASNATARLHLTVLALVKDSGGNVVQKFSEDFPVELSAERLAALKNATLSWHRTIVLRPGSYTIETAAIDREGNRSSVTRLQVESTESPGFGLSDLILVQRIEPVTGPEDATDPFQSQGKRLVPELAGVVSASAHPSVYFAIYPDQKSKEKPRITIELNLDGRLAGRQTSELPEPDATGSIAITIAAPAQPGINQLVITVQQGSQSASRTLEYKITAP